MPRGDKSAYTEKQKRQAKHIEESEKEQGRSEKRLNVLLGLQSINRMVGERKRKVLINRNDVF